MNPPTLLITFAVFVFGGISLINNAPLWEGSWKDGALVLAASEVAPGFASAASRKPGSGISAAPQGQGLPQGVTRF